MNQKGVWSLSIAGLSMAVASVLHIAIIVGGAEWYRRFGAGEELATLQEQGSIYPAALTFLIAMVLALFSAYAFSGAGFIKRLPMLKSVLIGVAVILLIRGFGALPLVLFASSGYLAELGEDLTFMWVSSLVCVVLGSCYLIGALQIPKTLVQD
jgi:putative oxidoreductase